MEEKIISALAQTPSILALLVIVFMFGRYLARKDSEFLEVIKNLNIDNISAREQSRLVIERNTAEAAHNTDALRQVTESIKKLVRKT